MKKRLIIFSSVALLALFSFKILDNRFEVSKNLEIFASVYKQVDLSYVDEPKPGELMRVGIDAMLKSLDPYTVFYSEAQAEDALTMRTGEYGGLGVNVTRIENYLVITDVFEGYAAEKAGIKIGDKLLSVNGKNVVGKTNVELSPLMKGAKGTFATIELQRGIDSLKTFNVERVEVKLKNVPYSGKIGNDIAYIHLTNFMQGAADEVKESLIKLKKQGCTSLILDLRDNPGGLLLEAVDIVNIFVPRNQLVVFTKGRTDANYREYKTKGEAVDLEMPVIVLINDRSASASEIVSGTLQDLDRAVVVGLNSFGKGLVQTTRGLPYRTQMKLTTAKYYTPSGRCIQSLNYGKRDEFGKPIKTADSLRQEFKTKSGRKVYDGGGIQPDVEVSFEDDQQIIDDLMKRHLIFDFAVSYKNLPEDISESYSFPPNEFNSFVGWLQNHKKRLKSPTDATIDQLEKRAKEESIFGPEELNNLRDLSWQKKENQIKTNKNVILDLIGLEIMRVSGLQSMHYKGKFRKDPTVIKAIEILKTPKDYAQLLNK